MSAPRVLVLTAILPEARALARAFHLAGVKNSPLPLWRNSDLAVVMVGVRAARINQVAQVPAVDGAELVIMAGVAGALSPALGIGDVVVEASAGAGALPPLGRAFFGRIITRDALLATPAGKRRLFLQTGGLAVDMETLVAAEFAAQRGAVFLALRGISDHAGQYLDPALLTLVNAAGYPRPAAAMAALLRRPWKVRDLWRLQRDTAKAMRGVAHTLSLVITSGWPAGAQKRRGVP